MIVITESRANITPILVERITEIFQRFIDYFEARKRPINNKKDLKVLSNKNSTPSKILWELGKIQKEQLLYEGFDLLTGINTDESSGIDYAHIVYGIKDRDSKEADRFLNKLILEIQSARDISDMKPLTAKELKLFTGHLFINLFLIRNEVVSFTAKELTAIYLHELGHVYYLKKNIYRLSESLHGKLNNFAGTLRKILTANGNDVVMALNSILIATYDLITLPVILNHKKYSYIEGEYLADLLPSEMSLRQDLQSALNKLNYIERTLFGGKTWIGKITNLITNKDHLIKQRNRMMMKHNGDARKFTRYL